MANKIQLRRDTATNWTTVNPILAQGEPGVELDTNKWKIGNGTSTWAVLQYQGTQLPANNAGYLYNNGSGTLSWGAIPTPGPSPTTGTVTSVGMNMGTTGLAVSPAAITSSGTFAITGTLAVQHGGTGANTAESALNNLLPAQSGQTNKYLRTNGSTATWETVPQYQLTSATTSSLGGVIVDGTTIVIDANGVISSIGGGTTATIGVTSVGMNMGTTGLTVSPGVITSAGTFAITGTLAIQHGGTGGTDTATALTALGAYPVSNPAGYTNNMGTVTSIGVTVPAGLTVSGSPITNSGTIAISTTLDGIVAATANTFTTVTVGSGLNYSSGTLTAQVAQRDVVTGTTTALAPATTASLDIIGSQNYVVYKIQTSSAAWVTLYINAASRTADAGRPQGMDPGANSGVIVEAITTGSQTVLVTPGVFGFNDETVPTSVIPIAVRNTSASTATISVTLTILKL